ncbi:MAG: ribonuclease HII [Bdellovibrionaceae bacterium]|nr:ribonuclease HII [Pseudobdellovibrionaceae bacterium]MDW8189529.1 ribonuclease HII [Pseudobdellovibrionaceae bacterium]
MVIREQQRALLFDILKPFRIWVGIDEVGRGCLAGPVVVAGAVPRTQLDSHVALDACYLFFDHSQGDDGSFGPIVMPNFFHSWLRETNGFKEDIMKDGSQHLYEKRKQIRDSKVLSDRQRRALLPSIFENYVVGLALSSPNEIERTNILQATLTSVGRVMDGFGKLLGVSTEGIFCIDGNQIVKERTVAQVALIKGDRYFEPISAASIVAKVFRDDVMRYLSDFFPLYRFVVHKGYATSLHRKALAQWGPCVLHRRQFRGVLS